MISKLSVMIQKACMLVSCIGCVITIVLCDATSQWRIGFMIALVASSIWHIVNTKCPHCGRFGGIKPKPFAQDAGKCVHCSEAVEYR